MAAARAAGEPEPVHAVRDDRFELPLRVGQPRDQDLAEPVPEDVVRGHRRVPVLHRDERRCADVRYQGSDHALEERRDLELAGARAKMRLDVVQDEHRNALMRETRLDKAFDPSMRSKSFSSR